MITLKLRPWVIIDNLDHIATSWDISTTNTFEVILDSITENTTHLNIYHSPVTVPVGVTYYIRAKRHFSNSTQSSWTTPKPVINTDTNNGLLLTTEVKVDKPIVYVSKEDLLNDEPTFVITTSTFRGTGDGHHSTSWIILDDTDNVIWKSMYNTVDKLSTIVTKEDLSYLDKNNLQILTIHNTTVGVESDIGSSYISFANFNFNIVSNMDRVIPNTDYTIRIRKVDSALTTGIVKVQVTSLDGETVVWTYLVTDDVTSFTIPGELLEPSSDYLVDFQATSTTTKINTKRKRLKTVASVATLTLDPNFTYAKTLTSTQSVSSPIIPEGCSLEEVFDNKIIVPSDTLDTLMFAEYDRSVGEIKPTTIQVGTISTLSKDNKDTFIKYLPDNTIVMDSYNTQGKPAFIVYKYNPYANTSSLTRAMSRTDETTCLGRNGSVYLIDPDTLYYVTPTGNAMKSMNFITGVFTTLPTPPNVNATSLAAINIGGRKLLVLGGEDMIGWIYDITTKTYIEGHTVPSKFRNRPLKVVPLVNGDSLIYRTTYDTNSDVDNNFLHYDITEGVLSELNYDFDTDFTPNTSIRMKTGKVLLVDGDDSQNRYTEFV